MLGLGKKNSDIPEAINEALPIDRIEDALSDLLKLGDNGVIFCVDEAIRQAARHNASDMHFEPWSECLALRFRLDGTLHHVASLPKEQQERILSRIKVLAKLIVYQKDIPQDGRIDSHADRLDTPLRVSTFPTIYGEKMVIRILDPRKDLLELDTLGFRDEVVNGLRDLIFRPQGTLLLTGPSSSGKTTTIYSLLRELMAAQDPSRNIATIEDPVEYQLGRVAQTQVNAHLGFNFESAFRSILRQDPDILMIGEIRDSDTARAAIQAGLTGHLVISTIHSGTAAGVFSRLLDMGIEPFLVASSVTGALAQRLVRANCTQCVQPYTPDVSLRSRYVILDDEVNFKKGAGCPACNGIGYSGRSAIGELLMVNDEIAELVLERSRTRRLQDAAVRNRMNTLWEHGLEKARSGLTTLEELRHVVPPAQQ